MSEFIVYRHSGYAGIPGKHHVAKVQRRGKVRATLAQSTGYDQQIDLSKIVVTFDNAEQAIGLQCELAEHREVYDKAVKAAREALELAIAQAIEARSGETERLDPKGESAVRQDAPEGDGHA